MYTYGIPIIGLRCMFIIVMTKQRTTTRLPTLSFGCSEAEVKYDNQSYFNNESVSVMLCDPPPAPIEPVKIDSISELEQSLSSDKMSSANNIRIMDGRDVNEGRVEIYVLGSWGMICGDRWTVLEARVVCRQTGHGLARFAPKTAGGSALPILLAGVACDGDETDISECYHEQSGPGTICQDTDMVAGVVCAIDLSDLVPNATLLEETAYVQLIQMKDMLCALQERCAAPSAFEIMKTQKDWQTFRRHLLRFSLSTWNFGTAVFYPASRREEWKWHTCHMHYHSMQMFVEYSVMDSQGTRVAEGYKTSFCLEDVYCSPGITPTFQCTGLNEQGISVGCADEYAHDTDCQWVDITDVKPGTYIFKATVNPEFAVGEIDFTNNVATCRLSYDGHDAKMSQCIVGAG